MAKADEAALNKLKELLNKGGVIQIETIVNGYEVTIWPTHGMLEHHHYQGDTLIEAIMKVKE